MGVSVDVNGDTVTSTGWTLIASANLSGPEGQTIKLLRKVAGGSEAASYTVNVGSGYLIAVAITVLSGRSGTYVHSETQVTTGVASGSTCSYTGVTASTSDDLYIFAASDNPNGGDTTGGFATPTSSGKTWISRGTARADTTLIMAGTVDNVSSGATGTVSTVVTTTAGNCGYGGFVVASAASGGGGVVFADPMFFGGGV